MSNRREAALCAEYAAWCAEQELPCLSADELIREDYTTAAQRTWLSDFIARWQAMVTAQGVG
jgi:hypothetical protein